jgi:regulator of protease activity HflC (stomatin/prohibitin superfamily)
MVLPAVADPASAPPTQPDAVRDPYRGAVLLLLVAAAAGSIAGFWQGSALANPVVLEAAITLMISTGVLLGVAVAQAARLKPRPAAAPASLPTLVDDDLPEASSEAPAEAEASAEPATDAPSKKPARIRDIQSRIEEWISYRKTLRDIRVATVAASAFAIVFINVARVDPATLQPIVAGVGAAVCLLAAGLAATAVRYFSNINVSMFPESLSLARGARIVAWIALLAAASIPLQWVDSQSVVRVMAAAAALVNVALCSGLYGVQRGADQTDDVFPLDLGVLSALGARTNVVGSLLDSAERQLGIDLRSTWALTVVRRSVEPLVIGLALVAWLSTSLTVVGVEEQGLVERLGVPVGGSPLQPGLHLHWPWPVDRVLRLPVQRVQMLTVGHEGKEESSGPEDVLWARQHAANEYTLLLGNGRDLITVDAAVQFRIADARAWQYRSQNPADALRAIAHRAVMRTTVNRTLAEALSENVVTTTARMRAMVQQDANALGLGVEVLGFTVGGMHPPVAVSADYQGVVSAELGKITAVVNAEADRNRNVPLAVSAAEVGRNGAIAEGARALAQATGEAWSFLALQSQYRAAPAEYFFRRRLETLEQGLPSRRLTILDYRFQRDGGELWVTP